MRAIEVGDLQRFCSNEYKDYAVYSMFARLERRQHVKRLLEELARVEYEHYTHWKRHIADYQPRVSGLQLFLYRFAKFFFGLLFIIKLLERHEMETIKRYKKYLNVLDEDERMRLERIIMEEEGHERALLAQIDERAIKYMGFVALGLADAIIEVSGVHAGFLGVTSSTLIAGIAGLIVGFAASLSMAVAAYVQSKSMYLKRPIYAALTTGASYIVAVILMALPYFLTADMFMAFFASIAMAISIGGSFTFYSAVINDRPIGREMAENVLLLLGIAAATFFFGEFLGRVFGIQPVLSHAG
ncbi:MAG: VIT1/CCC1 family protein [Nitrososphaerota archaeon]|nr:VIT1/CCC1 family protein [Nitrososphaerota archaeon]